RHRGRSGTCRSAAGGAALLRPTLVPILQEEVEVTGNSRAGRSRRIGRNGVERGGQDVYGPGHAGQITEVGPTRCSAGSNGHAGRSAVEGLVERVVDLGRRGAAGDGSRREVGGAGLPVCAAAPWNAARQSGRIPVVVVGAASVLHG